MRLSVRAAIHLLLGAALAVVALAGLAARASASANQVAVFEDDARLQTDPLNTLSELRTLGVGIVRVSVRWNEIAPNPWGNRMPPGFNPTSPRAAGYTWQILDQVVRAAPMYGIKVDLSLTGGAPLWATGGGKPPGGRYPNWRPNASQFGKFVQAVGARYSGKFVPTGASTPLPRVSMWEIWNEPNFGPDLGPQAVASSTRPSSAPMYRSLVDAAWAGLAASAHGHDQVLLGNLDARGQSGPPSRYAPQGFPGNFAATKPLLFIRQLYCLNSAYRPLRGRLASADGCPTTAAGTRRFRAAHPALFAASGFADHPYPFQLSPTQVDSSDPDQAEFPELPRFVRTVDRVERAYGSGHRFAVYDNEFGYITNPPNHSKPFPSPGLAAAYINQAEYLSWLNPRVVSTDQYLLTDPSPFSASDYGGFASGLEFTSRRHKPAYDAYRLPIYLPVTKVKRGRAVLVWGCARPAQTFANTQVTIDFQAGSHGPFTTLRTVSVTNAEGYFAVHVVPPTSGSVRLTWSYPGGGPAHSRTVLVKVT